MQFRNKNPLNMSNVWLQVNFFLKGNIFPDSFHILSLFSFTFRNPISFLFCAIKD